jgi:hypothetical protein
MTHDPITHGICVGAWFVALALALSAPASATDDLSRACGAAAPVFRLTTERSSTEKLAMIASGGPSQHRMCRRAEAAGYCVVPCRGASIAPGKARLEAMLGLR